MLRIALFLFISCFSFYEFSAKSYDPDSLKAIINSPLAHDTSKMDALHRLSWNIYMSNNPDSALHYAFLQLELAEKNKDLNRISSAYNDIAVSRHIKGLLSEALPYYEKSLLADEQIAATNPNNKKAIKGVAVSLANIGILYQQIGDLQKAISSYLKALKSYEALQQQGVDVTMELAGLRNSIGMAHQELQNYDEAEKWFYQSLDNISFENQPDQYFSAKNNLGKLFNQLGKQQASKTSQISYYQKSEKYFNESLRAAKSSKNRRQQAIALNNIGSAQRQYTLLTIQKPIIKDFSTAQTFLQEALEISIDIDDPGNIALALYNISEILFATNNLNQAFFNAEKGLQYAHKSEELSKVSALSELLYRIAKKQNKKELALKMFELHITARDSINNEENKKEVLRRQFLYDYEKKEALLIADQEKQNALNKEELRRKTLQKNISVFGLTMMVFVALVFFKQRQSIKKEKKRSDNLLLNILPQETAEELKNKGSAQAKHFNSVTVLFTDFKGFTALSEQLSPSDVVNLINECFSEFDKITTKFNIEKIKTIGDAYMAASGLPKETVDHAERVVSAAIEIRNFMQIFKSLRQQRGLPYFEIRIGIHTGPVVAGIVGIKKFQYDIWGDTVNTASRMESSGEVGMINISETTYSLIKNSFACAARGKIQAKGKGDMNMYFVVS